MIEKYLEATNLDNKAKQNDIRDFVLKAEEQKCYGVCSYLSWANRMKQYAKNCKIICVIGFPQGNPFKIQQDLSLINNSIIDEYDVVIPLGFVKHKRNKDFLMMMKYVRKVTNGKVLKAIIETCVLDEKEFKTVIKICEHSGVDFIKTNTGLYKRNRPIEKDVELITQYTKLPIKASGGISTYEQANKLIEMGVIRIGTSNPSRIIIEEYRKDNTNVKS
jgi:deoxyribose-phosphate aldolase